MTPVPGSGALVGALALIAVAALVVAIGASNESIDQKKLAAEATRQVEAKVSGLGEAVEAADELQAEGKQRAAADRRQIQKEVEEAVADGETELDKVKRRVGKTEGELADQAKANTRLEKQIASLDSESEELREDVKELKTQLKELTRSVSRASR